MAKRLSMKLSNENDWLLESLEKERKKQCRPSINNMAESILVTYFMELKEKKENGK